MKSKVIDKRLKQLLAEKSRYYLETPGGGVKNVPLLEWARMFERKDFVRRVAETFLPPKIRVSTVFLGLDHSWDSGPPVLYETMVFGGVMDQEQWRYCTRRQAFRGHAAMVARVKKHSWIANAIANIGVWRNSLRFKWTMFKWKNGWGAIGRRFGLKVPKP